MKESSSLRSNNSSIKLWWYILLCKHDLLNWPVYPISKCSSGSCWWSGIQQRWFHRTIMWCSTRRGRVVIVISQYGLGMFSTSAGNDICSLHNSGSVFTTTMQADILIYTCKIILLYIHTSLSLMYYSLQYFSY